MGQVRKKKKRRKKRYLLKLVIFVALFISAYFFFTSEIFDIQKIQVEENSYYTAEQVIGIAGAKTGVSLFKVHTAKMKDRLLDDPYIQTAKVSRHLPNRLIITVEERKEFAAVAMENADISQGALTKKASKKKTPKTSEKSSSSGVAQATAGAVGEGAGGAPSPTDGALAPTDGAPASTDGAPASTAGAPASTAGAPAPTDGAPASTDGAPASTDGAPVPATSVVPTGTVTAPVAPAAGVPATADGTPAPAAGTPAPTDASVDPATSPAENAAGQPPAGSSSDEIPPAAPPEPPKIGTLYVLLDRDGMVLRKTDKSPTIPVIYGLTVKEAEPGKPLKVEENLMFSDTLGMVKSMNQNDLFFKKIQVNPVVIKAYIYDNLICEGPPDVIEKSMKSLKDTLYVLYQQGIQRGVIHASGDDHMPFTFSPVIEQ